MGSDAAPLVCISPAATEGEPDVKSKLDRLARVIREANAQAQKDRAFFAEASARPRELKAPDAAEKALLDRVRGDIKDFVDLMWEGYSDPELALWRTRYQRKQTPFIDVAAEAATLRTDTKARLEQLLYQCGGGAAKAARLGLMLRIQRTANGNASTKNSGVMGAYDDVISDTELAPIAAVWNKDAPGAPANGENGKWELLRQLLVRYGGPEEQEKPTADGKERTRRRKNKRIDLRKEWSAFEKLLAKHGRMPPT